MGWSSRYVTVALILVAVASMTSHAARRDRIELRRVVVDLPGEPASIVPADLDGDGRLDLAVVTSYDEVESTTRDVIEDGMQITRVIPSLTPRRDVRGWIAADDGTYRPTDPLDLPESVHTLEPGPDGWPAFALTDDGLSVLRFDGERTLTLEPELSMTTALAGTDVFLPELRLARDLDGDDDLDVIVPAESGILAWIDPASAGRPPVPTGLVSEVYGRSILRSYPWPTVTRVDGDAIPDLVVFEDAKDGAGERFRVLIGRGDGTFRPLRGEGADCNDRSELRYASTEGDGAVDGSEPPWPPDLAAVRDLDGDGRAELIRRRQIEREGDGLGATMKDAKRPRHRFEFHRLDEDGNVAPEPYAAMTVEGHMLEEAGPFTVDPFVDLDGDGREELVLVTLRFTILQAVRILVAKKISIGVDFNVFTQTDDGTFRAVGGNDLSERLKLDLRRLELRQFAQFAGDFDGDGLRDFVHFGRGREITIHRGEAGARYPKKPDLTVPLETEPQSLTRVSVEDLDGDGRSDIALVQPLETDDPDETAPARLELYLSGDLP